jgi:hypothetical protein
MTYNQLKDIENEFNMMAINAAIYELSINDLTNDNHFENSYRNILNKFQIETAEIGELQVQNNGTANVPTGYIEMGFSGLNEYLITYNVTGNTNLFEYKRETLTGFNINGEFYKPLNNQINFTVKAQNESTAIKQAGSIIANTKDLLKANNEFIISLQKQIQEDMITKRTLLL